MILSVEKTDIMKLDIISFIQLFKDKNVIRLLLLS